MLVELKLIRRQDLVAVISDIMKPSQDQLHIKIELSSDIMDPFVFCVATKRTASKFFKEMYDLVSTLQHYFTDFFRISNKLILIIVFFFFFCRVNFVF